MANQPTQSELDPATVTKATERVNAALTLNGAGGAGTGTGAGVAATVTGTQQTPASMPATTAAPATTLAPATRRGRGKGKRSKQSASSSAAPSDTDTVTITLSKDVLAWFEQQAAAAPFDPSVQRYLAWQLKQMAASQQKQKQEDGAMIAAAEAGQ